MNQQLFSRNTIAQIKSEVKAMVELILLFSYSTGEITIELGCITMYNRNLIWYENGCLILPSVHDFYYEHNWHWCCYTHERTNETNGTVEWFDTVEKPRLWKTSRSFCGKLQDYAKNVRTWRTFDQWVLLRFRIKWRQHRRGVGSNFFVLKMNALSPCSNFVLTEPHGTIDLTVTDLQAR